MLKIDRSFFANFMFIMFIEFLTNFLHKYKNFVMLLDVAFLMDVTKEICTFFDSRKFYF